MSLLSQQGREGEREGGRDRETEDMRAALSRRAPRRASDGERVGGVPTRATYHVSHRLTPPARDGACHIDAVLSAVFAL